MTKRSRRGRSAAPTASFWCRLSSSKARPLGQKGVGRLQHAASPLTRCLPSRIWVHDRVASSPPIPGARLVYPQCLQPGGGGIYPQRDKRVGIRASCASGDERAGNGARHLSTCSPSKASTTWWPLVGRRSGCATYASPARVSCAWAGAPRCSMRQSWQTPTKSPCCRAYLKRWKAEVGVFFQGVGADASESELLRIAPAIPCSVSASPPPPERAAVPGGPPPRAGASLPYRLVPALSSGSRRALNRTELSQASDVQSPTKVGSRPRRSGSGPVRWCPGRAR